jgi:hypothetical protein
MLLSPRATLQHTGEHGDQYTCCQSCYASLSSSSKEERSTPPKFAIANGFAIGHIPRIMAYRDSNGEVHTKIIDLETDLDDKLSAAIAPVRPFGFVHAFTGGSQKSITGHFSFFSVNQSHIGGVLNKFNDANAGKNIFVVLCGRMTPSQRAEIRGKSKLNSEVFLHLLNWFVRESGHMGYSDVTPPNECPNPIVILQDDENANNTDESVDEDVELKFGQKKFFFSSSAQNPTEDASVFDNSAEFLQSLLENNTPTMLMYGGNYVKGHEMRLEDAFPIQFPFGIGGLHSSRRVPVSAQSCLQHYMRLSLNQFMRPEFILVCYQLLCRSKSYTTGLVKCRSDCNGVQLAEKLSRLTVNELRAACEIMTNSARQGHSDLTRSVNDGVSFLKSVTTSCKVHGHTTEAAKEARRMVYAMSERYGAHSVFLTVTPDDQCCFRVRMYASNGEEIDIPSPDCSEARCIADFVCREETRTKYPGACSINYQSCCQQIFDLLGWDYKGEKYLKTGFLGDCVAFIRADEEQGRGTLHGHWLIWIRGFDKVRDKLFSCDQDEREYARTKMKEYVDVTFCSSYNYNRDLFVTHDQCKTTGTVQEVFCQCEDQVLRDSRFKESCKEVQGKILRCRCCVDGDESKKTISTKQMSDMMLSSMKHQCDNLQLNGTSSVRDDHVFPPSKYRRDIMTYRYSLDRRSLSESVGDFYSDTTVRHHIATGHMNEHDCSHRPSCFKYGSECRYFFPKPVCDVSGVFDEDNSANNLTVWRTLGGDDKSVYPFVAKTKRGIGSQYLNTHSEVITKLFGCNSNIQMGSPRCVFYVIHYSTKSTQKEDRGIDYDRIGNMVMRRIERTREKIDLDIANGNLDSSEEVNHFREGLCRFLIGMNIHMAQDVVSATMAHLLISQDGSRFTFSHQFRDLLLGQMLNHLDGNNPGDFVLKRLNKGESGEVEMWPDYSVNDYVFRDDELEDMSYYEFVSTYHNNPFTFRRMNKRDSRTGLPKLNENEYAFKEGHPGRRYCCLKKHKRCVVPKISMPKNMICDIENLDQHNDNPSDSVIGMRESYAKAALTLFYPFRNNELFNVDSDEDLWSKLKRLMSDDKFCPYGAAILQNMQDNIQSRKCKLPRDELEATTTVPKCEKTSENNCYTDEQGDLVFENAGSFDEYDYEQLMEHGIEEEDANVTSRRNLNDLKRLPKGKGQVGFNSIINSRADQSGTLFEESGSDHCDASRSQPSGNNNVSVHSLHVRILTTHI